MCANRALLLALGCGDVSATFILFILFTPFTVLQTVPQTSCRSSNKAVGAWATSLSRSPRSAVMGVPSSRNGFPPTNYALAMSSFSASAIANHAQCASYSFLWDAGPGGPGVGPCDFAHLGGSFASLEPARVDMRSGPKCEFRRSTSSWMSRRAVSWRPVMMLGGMLLTPQLHSLIVSPRFLW